MSITGRCYCGDIHYQTDAEPVFRGLCHCRECQYLTGGMGNLCFAVPEPAFTYTSGTPKSFTRPDLDSPVTREFCPNCGTQLLTRSPHAPGLLIVKAGTLDDQSLIERPDTAIWMSEARPYHLVQEGVPTFERFPPPRQDHA